MNFSLYFGPLSDWQSALNRYRAEVEDLVQGRTPESRNIDGLAVLDLLNRFLHFKRGLVNTGELTLRSWYDYHQTGEHLLKVFGKNKIVETLTPADFERLRADYGNGKWGAVRIAGEINRARIIFRYAFESGLVDKPVHFGPGSSGPTARRYGR